MTRVGIGYDVHQFAENRPLKTLLEMKNNAHIEFTETDYELQYKLYYEVMRLSCQVRKIIINPY